MSNDEKKYTEKDLILAKRMACDTLAREITVKQHVKAATVTNTPYSGSLSDTEITRLRDILFPRPRITRPRVMTSSGGVAYRVADGRLQVQQPSGHWEPRYNESFNGMVRDLFANPTETVEDDA
jgi:hypothetical protein